MNIISPHGTGFFIFFSIKQHRSLDHVNRPRKFSPHHSRHFCLLIHYNRNLNCVFSMFSDGRKSQRTCCRASRKLITQKHCARPSKLPKTSQLGHLWIYRVYIKCWPRYITLLNSLCTNNVSNERQKRHSHFSP